MSTLSPLLEKHLNDCMQKCGIGAADQQILGSIASECWYLELDDPENLPIGGSRIGGDPDLPDSLHWPDGESEPMSFLLQIRLEDIQSALPHGMPRSGMLYFFVEDDENSLNVIHKLLWSGDLSGLSRRKPQGRTRETEQRHGIPGACSLKVVHGVDLPIYDNLPLKLYQEDSGFEMLQNLENLLRGSDDREAVCGKIFGSFSAQNPVLKNVAALFLERATTELSAKEHFGDLYEIVKANQQSVEVDPHLLEHEMKRWTRLLWLDSNFEVGFNIWDAGSYSVLMRLEDIASHNFARSHVMLETC